MFHGTGHNQCFPCYTQCVLCYRSAPVLLLRDVFYVSGRCHARTRPYRGDPPENHHNQCCPCYTMCSMFQVAAMREPDRIEATLLKIIDLYNEGKIKPRIDSVWSFDAVSNKTFEFSQNAQKLVITRWRYKF